MQNAGLYIQTRTRLISNQLFQQKQRVGENVQDNITSLRATAARLDTPDRQVLEAIMKGFLPEIRGKVVMRDPHDELESAAVLSETTRTRTLGNDSTSTCTSNACNSKSDIQDLVQAMSELVKSQSHSIQAIQSQGERHSFKGQNYNRQNSKFSRQNNKSNFNISNSFKCYSCGKTGHRRIHCRYSQAVCNGCRREGHIPPACGLKKPSSRSYSQ